MDSLVPAEFHTNLDKFRTVQWPDSCFINIAIGHRVQSKDGRYSLKVVGITHCFYMGRSYYLSIELHE